MAQTITQQKLTLMLASPRGFCAGVARAVSIVEEALSQYGAPVFVRHQIVHNQAVVQRLEKMGAVFVENLDEIPVTGSEDTHVIFSAHGVAPDIITKAKARGFQVLDATCPLVSKVHSEVRRHKEQGRHIFLIGHRNHPEMIGTIGHIGAEGWNLIETVADAKAVEVPAQKTAYATQTTLSVTDTAKIIDALKARFPDIAPPNGEDICYATTNRQNAVCEIAPLVDKFFILGAENSSNAKRLVETARASGAKHAALIGSANDINWLALSDGDTEAGEVWGLSAGASTPDFLVTQVIETLQNRFTLTIKTLPSVQEKIVFKLPAELR